MLAIAKLAPGQEAYYERSVADGLEDYYAGRGESPGVWAGTGAASLGLTGVVAEGDLGRVVSGVDPSTGSRLRRHIAARTITMTRVDPATGDVVTQRHRLAPVAGYDLVFSPPKSVSLLHALGDEETRLAVTTSHERAWNASLRYLEQEACVTRRGAQGRIAEHAGGFVAAAFQHRTSRAQDPHLHTHVIVANMAQAPDGRWRALDGRAILEEHRLAAGYLYQAQLRAELSRSLGVEWETPTKGMAEIRGIPHTALVEFSQRRRQVVERLALLDSDGYYAAQLAATDTRDRKEHVELATLRRDWWGAAEHGLTRTTLAACLGRTRWREPLPAELAATVRALVGPRGLTEKQTTFTGAEAVMAWANACQRGADAETLVELAEALLEASGVEALAEPVPGRSGRYSTHELMAAERSVLDVVERGRTAAAPAAALAAVVRATQASSVRLSAEQQTYVRVAATSRERVVCVVGVAGAGKTTATRALVGALKASGIPVLGAAPSGAAAEKLADETGMRATTIHRLLIDAELDDGLPRSSVVIVDEAGMADSRTLGRILALIEAADGKAILVGDPAQLPAVGAGGLFEAIIDRVGAVELNENRRQRDGLEREALAYLREGRGREYVRWADEAERLVTAEDAIAARSRLLADWWEHARHDAIGNVMIALRRRDVATLNAFGRALRDAAGQLGPERLVVGRQEFAVGDRLVCLRNSSAVGVRNGTRGTIVGVDRDGIRLTVATDRGDRVDLDATYVSAGYVRHAYALTGHASQGATVDRAFVLAPMQAAAKEWGYVAVGRAVEETRVYAWVTTGAAFAADAAQNASTVRPIDILTASLQRSSADTPAIAWPSVEQGRATWMPSAEVHR